MDWDIERPIDVFVDATAGKGIAERKGVGRIRHLHGPLLWIQKAVEGRLVNLKKVDRSKNVADLGTTHVTGPALQKLLQFMGFEMRSGSSRVALQAQV